VKERLIGLEFDNQKVKFIEVQFLGGKIEIISKGQGLLEAVSAEEIGKKLASLLEKHKIKTRLAALSISGPEVLLRQFDLSRLPMRELKNSLRLEAVESISYPGEEIELDYQVLSSSKEKINGVFVTLPKKLLEKHLTILHNAGLIPVVVNAGFLAKINSFLYRRQVKEDVFCFLDFSSQDIVSLVLFVHKQCQFLRQIHYEDVNQVVGEITSSLKYYYAKSFYKEVDKIYICSGHNDSTEIKNCLNQELNIEIEICDSLKDLDLMGLVLPNSFFKINLMRNYAVSLASRRRILEVINFSVAVCLILCLILFFQIMRTNLAIKDLRSSIGVLSNAK
jgi:Tfp pilus assembly PilM family ATPase